MPLCRRGARIVWEQWGQVIRSGSAPHGITTYMSISCANSQQALRVADESTTASCTPTANCLLRWSWQWYAAWCQCFVRYGPHSEGSDQLPFTDGVRWAGTRGGPMYHHSGVLTTTIECEICEDTRGWKSVGKKAGKMLRAQTREGPPTPPPKI